MLCMRAQICSNLCVVVVLTPPHCPRGYGSMTAESTELLFKVIHVQDTCKFIVFFYLAMLLPLQTLGLSSYYGRSD